MRKYKVKIREILELTIEVEAKDKNSAIEEIKDLYREEKILLNWEDVVDTKIY